MSRLFALFLILTLAMAPITLAQGDDNETETSDADKSAEEARKEAEERARDEAEDKDEKDNETEAESEEEREVKIDVSDSVVTIELEHKNGELKDEVKIEYDADEATMKIESGVENATVERTSELKVKFEHVVEYRDVDEDGGFGPDVDEEVARFSHEDLDWRIEGPTDVTSAAGAAGKRIVGIGAFPGGGALTFVLYVYGEFAVVNGTSLQPTDAKIDILIDDFPYAANDTRTALITKVEQESETKLEKDAEGDPSGFLAEGPAGIAYFTWAGEALVDGTMRPVVATLLESETENETESDEAESKVEQTVALSYPRGTHINHDPVLGVQSSTTAVVTKDAPGLGLVGVTLAVGVAALVVLRRRSR